MATGMARQPQPGSPPTVHKLFLPFSSNREQKLVAKDTSATSSNLPVAPPLLDASITCMVRPSRELPAGLAFAIMETRGEARRTGEAGGKALTGHDSFCGSQQTEGRGWLLREQGADREH